MTRPRMRPTFEETLPTSIANVTAQLISGLKDPEAPVRGKVGLRSAEIVVARSERDFWSPYLSLAFDEREGRVIMFGRFSPHPSVWSGFLASYTILGSIALFAGIYAFSQWSIGQSPTALYVVVGALFFLGTSFGSTFIGQNLGSDQMYVLRHFVDRCIERAAEQKPADRGVEGPEG